MSARSVRHRGRGLALALALVALSSVPFAAARADQLAPAASTTYRYYILHARAPGAVVDSARAHLARWAGPELARKWFTLDSTASTYMAPRPAAPEEPSIATLAGSGASVLPSPGWRVTFNLHVPSTPCVDQPVVVQVDTTGTLIGIASAETVETKPRCGLAVGREDAMSVARSNALATGVKPWEVQLGWVARFGRLAWSLSNTLEESGACSANGETVVIDAKTGEILGRSSWSRGC